MTYGSITTTHPLERALVYCDARYRALGPVHRALFRASIWTCSSMIALVAVVGYARLWYYWTEVTLAAHFVVPLTFILWALRPGGKR